MGARATPKVTRPTDEDSPPYAVWCHLNAPPAAVAPRGPVCPCLAAFKVHTHKSNGLSDAPGYGDPAGASVTP